MLVKVCGILSLENAMQCVEAGADALGLNFYPKSPRYIRPEAAAPIAEGLRGKALRVGLFVNETPEFIADVAKLVQLDALQLHGGGEAPALGIPVWRAFNVGADFKPADVEDDNAAEAFVLDSPAPGGVHGGTGKTFDWTRVATLTKRIILAGGLDASNVAEAIRIARPWGVDASSRLESAPGIKDPAKVAAFAAAAKRNQEGL